MNEMILLKLGEMVLKGLNRRSFEDKLQANIYRRLNNLGQFRVYTRQSTTYVEPMTDGCDMDGAWEALTRVFGVVGLSRARACEKDKDAILAAAREYLGGKLSSARTFKVTVFPVPVAPVIRPWRLAIFGTIFKRSSPQDAIQIPFS